MPEQIGSLRITVLSAQSRLADHSLLISGLATQSVSIHFHWGCRCSQLLLMSSKLLEAYYILPLIRLWNDEPTTLSSYWGWWCSRTLFKLDLSYFIAMSIITLGFHLKVSRTLNVRQIYTKFKPPWEGSQTVLSPFLTLGSRVEMKEVDQYCS